MKIYISGPISGLKPAAVRKVFDAAAKKIRQFGHTPADPSALPDPEIKNPQHHHYLQRDLRLLWECQMLCALPGWEDSSGCLRELWFASRESIPCVEFRYLSDAFRSAEEIASAHGSHTSVTLRLGFVECWPFFRIQKMCGVRPRKRRK